MMIAIVVSATASFDDASHCLTGGDCLSPRSPTCRVHNDTGNWEKYRWRNAYTMSTGGLVTHEYAYCSNGTGPYAYTASGLSVDDCAAKCSEVHCKCFDFFCEYHPFANCTCPEAVLVTPVPNATKVACVGDSITAGYLSSCGLNYPNQLQTLLGPDYHVSNYGVGGTTLLRHADHPYWNTSSFQAAVTSDADIVVVALGTNDAKKQNWDALSSQYPVDYKALVDTFRAMPSRPTVYIAIPPPLYRDGVYGMLQTAINTDLPRLIPQIAAANELPPPIDLFALFQAHCPIVFGTPGHPPNSTDLSCDWIGSGGWDACHPGDVGYLQVAKAVQTAIQQRTSRVSEVERME